MSEDIVCTMSTTIAYLETNVWEFFRSAKCGSVDCQSNGCFIGPTQQAQIAI